MLSVLPCRILENIFLYSLNGYMFKWNGSMIRLAMKVCRDESGCRVASLGKRGSHTRAPRDPHHSHRARESCVCALLPPPHDQTLSTHDASTVAGKQLYAC